MGERKFLFIAKSYVECKEICKRILFSHPVIILFYIPCGSRAQSFIIEITLNETWIQTIWIPFLKRLKINTTTLSAQSGDNLLPSKIIINTRLHSWSNTLWKLSSISKMLWEKWTSRTISVENVVDLENAHLKDKILFITSVTIRFISIDVTVSREIGIVGTYTVIPQIIFRNGKPIILLYKIINI